MIKIVTDSTAYLSPKEIEKYGITVVPLNIQLGNESFEESKISNAEFFHRLRTNRDLFPTTSQPSVGKFLEAYKRLASPNDDIISIHLSGEISGTVKSAQSAARLLPKYSIDIVDSMTSVAGQGLIVKEAAYLAQQGKSKKEIFQAIEYLKNNLTTLFMVDDLEYLKRGGRIGGASALLGTFLQIKPILTIKGKINVYQKVRTKQKALTVIIDALEKTVNAHGYENMQVVIMNVDAKNEAEKFADLIKQRCSKLTLEHSNIGQVIGAHVGPGAIGIAFTPAFKPEAK